MEETPQLGTKRWPVMFCCAIVAPYPIMAVGGSIASRYMPLDRGSYTPLNIILAFVVVELVTTWSLVVWGWIRGERPRWLAFFAPVLSIWFVWHIFFA